MLDFTQKNSGTLGTIVRFSDVFTAALAHKLTGTIRVKHGEILTDICLNQGNPVLVATDDSEDANRLGIILTELELSPSAAVEAACAVQEQQSEDERTTLGKILIDFGDANEQSIRQAILHQTSHRLASLFALEEGAWQATSGVVPVAEANGIAMQGWPFLLPALKHHASENELRDVSEALLGKSVKLRGTLPNLDILGFDSADKELISLIEKPRKPDQLERAIKNRRSVRSVLKLLGLCGNLELLPVKEGVPISSTVRIKVQKSAMPSPQPVSNSEDSPSRSSSSSQRPRTSASSKVSKRPRSSLSNKAGSANSPAAREIKRVFEKLNDLNYFQLLEIREDTSFREIRLRYTTLSKKYHPDAIGPNQPAEVKEMARAIAVKLNAAYSTLGDEEKRKKYQASLTGAGVAKAGQDSGQLESARVKFEMGNSLLRKGDFQRARDYFHFAMANDPNNGVYKAYYAWAIFSDRSKSKAASTESAYPLMRTAAAACQDHVNVQFYAGKVFQAQGDKERAKASLERVLALQPGHDGATSALRALDTGVKEKSEETQSKPESAKEKLSKLFRR
ncbi:MAG: J domain-containing protein [Myxococcota bacterium]|nr:J domain-containing protein [Myxococcota bacterium]